MLLARDDDRGAIDEAPAVRTGDLHQLDPSPLDGRRAVNSEHREARRAIEDPVSGE